MLWVRGGARLVHLLPSQWNRAVAIPASVPATQTSLRAAAQPAVKLIGPGGVRSRPPGRVPAQHDLQADHPHVVGAAPPDATQRFGDRRRHRRPGRSIEAQDGAVLANGPDVARRRSPEAAQALHAHAAPFRPGRAVPVKDYSALSDGPDVIRRSRPDIAERVALRQGDTQHHPSTEQTPPTGAPPTSPAARASIPSGTPGRPSTPVGPEPSGASGASLTSERTASVRTPPSSGGSSPSPHPMTPARQATTSKAARIRAIVPHPCETDGRK